MKPKDLRERSAEDLRDLEKSLAKDTFQNRFKNFTNRLDDTSQLPKTRRDLARVKTILRQLEVAAQIKAETGVEVAKPAAKPAKKTTAKKASAKAASATTTKKASAKKEAK
jgi:large subunit ribosomal protein L29